MAMGGIGQGIFGVGGVGSGLSTPKTNQGVGSGVRNISQSRWSTPTKSRGGSYRPSAPAAAMSGPIAPVAPPPPSLEEWLNMDAGYQQQLRDFANALAQFNADVTRRRGDLEMNFGNSKKAMEDQKVKDLDLMEDDYGARGILRSGLYGKAVTDYNTEFGNRMTDLQTQQNQALGDLTSEQNRYTSQQELQKQAAREDAIRRRAAQYGL